MTSSRLSATAAPCSGQALIRSTPSGQPVSTASNSESAITALGCCSVITWVIWPADRPVFSRTASTPSSAQAMKQMTMPAWLRHSSATLSPGTTPRACRPLARRVARVVSCL